MMKSISCSMFLLVLIMCVALSGVSHGIELNPIKERIEETIKLGETNPGKKIFETDLVKAATFGNWPNYGGGLIKTKLVGLAVMAAMKRKARKNFNEEDAQAMMGSDVLTISYRGGEDVFKIQLSQGDRLIEPVEMLRPDMSKEDANGHAAFYSVSFPYAELDLKKMTTILILKDFGDEKYKVDFSRIR
ncbi:MAG: hypothetical protein K8F52_16290 [Candidatus Scalindua rubra]|uniref:Uncharacterized protein n=1 Tax=Candidatus Scalindua brodae TaxID=237368 RepID=A0A0B0EAH2_9BACT|nr:MAG: hypothetical protein SCABRO_03949 [Candidatus Scalindua brodae]MBZ0110211.1 hypothetical protein [Candidatus Scalindua rubra]TWU29027.1 hypothetical protein S225a_26650 [Candidatus Brocadiaceae bacterium S225]